MESNSDFLQRDAVLTSAVPELSKGRGASIFTGQLKPSWSVEILGTLHPLLGDGHSSVGMETRYGLYGPVI